MKESGFLTKVAIYFLGLSSIANLFIIYNYDGIVKSSISENFQTLLVLLIGIPQIIMTPFTPKIMKMLSAKTIVVIQYVVQISMLIGTPFLFTSNLSKTTLKIVYLSICLASILVCSVFLGASFFWASLYGNIEVTYVATGMCTGGAITPLIFIILDQTGQIANIKLFLSICSGYIVFFHLMAIFGFVYLYRNSLAEKVKTALSNDNNSSVGTDVYIKVIKQKWVWLLLSFMLFLILFIPFPWLIYSGWDSRNTLNGFIMAAIFGFSELFSRIAYMKAEKFLNKIYNKKNVPIIFVIFVILCSVPIVFFYLKRSNIAFNKFTLTVGYEVLITIIWVLIATNLGFMGNVTTVCICNDLKTDEETSIACSLQPLVNITGIFLGVSIAHILKISTT